MSDIILHHYPQSPVSEKVRVALGIKKLSWKSVQVRRLPPRDELFALTGGYRRIPVMQIGADIYCDTLCILRELERRFPKPTFYPTGAAGMPYALSRWTDENLFNSTVRLAFAPAAGELPADLVTDRSRLYLGAGKSFQDEVADLPHLAAQLRAQFSWLEEQLADGRKFLEGSEPSLDDCYAYYIVWFLRGRWEKGPDFISEFEKLLAWEERVKDLGHGTASTMTPDEALDIGTQAQPKTPEQADPRDAQGLEPGMDAEVVQDADTGEAPVAGVIRAVTRDVISLHRIDRDAGLVCMHFPRVGYRVTVTG